MSDPDPTPDLTFADLGIDPRILRALTDVGYESPSPIQAETIPLLLQGRDVVGLAQTGTGKTAAFAVPILSRIDIDRRIPQVLVLAPTRELALQVAEAFGRYAAHLPGLHVLPIYGGQGYGPQLSALRRGVQVVVGTPGRVIDHLEKRTLDLSGVTHLVLDEADEMLRMGFAEDVERILADTPDTKVVALFSATIPPQIRRISQQYLRDPAEITVRTRTTTLASTRQRYLQVAGSTKLDALTRILEVEKFDAMIVFVRTKQATEVLAERLRSRGHSASAINGDMVQAQRERTIGALKDASIDILVATDVAARGLDVERISHVLNYDIPLDTESYVHRIGRTGRAGREGDALLFVTPRERHLLRAIEKATRQPLTPMGLPSVDDVNSTRIAKFRDSVTASRDGHDLTFFRGLIADYEQQHDVPAVDVAAALAVLLYDEQSFLLEPEQELSTAAFSRDTETPQSRGKGRSGPGRTRDSHGAEMATYRIRVGKRHKATPNSIVGAIANEGGLSRGDFGHIDIRGDHSLVELPAQLSQDTWDSLRRTRIAGQLISLSKDDGPASRRPSGKPAARDRSAAVTRKKPRWKADRPR